MSAILDHLIEFTSKPASFKCRIAGRKADTNRTLLVRLKNILNPPATKKNMSVLAAMLGDWRIPFEEVFRTHDGFVLYKDLDSDTAGIEAYPVSLWKEATQDMKKWLAGMELDRDPDHLRSAIAFATVPESGNYFVVPVEGPSAGKIFYLDHDGWYDSPFANDFGEFVARITKEPAKLLSEDLGCIVRYSDGKTPIQWIPEEFEFD